LEIPPPPPEPVVEEVEEEEEEKEAYDEDSMDVELQEALRASLVDDGAPKFKTLDPRERVNDGGLVEGASMTNPSKIRRLIDDIKHIRIVNPVAKVTLLFKHNSRGSVLLLFVR